MELEGVFDPVGQLAHRGFDVQPLAIAIGMRARGQRNLDARLAGSRLEIDRVVADGPGFHCLQMLPLEIAIARDTVVANPAIDAAHHTEQAAPIDGCDLAPRHSSSLSAATSARSSAATASGSRTR